MSDDVRNAILEAIERYRRTAKPKQGRGALGGIASRTHATNELADAIGTSPTTLRHLIRGLRLVNAEKAMQISQGLERLTGVRVPWDRLCSGS
jgi:transcriptional regulator with XRE-family HTH domain